MKCVEKNEPIRRVRLARALSKLGYCSRSRAEELIRTGEVRLNGIVKRDPEHPVRLDKDKITVADQAIKLENKIYLVMNKPRGVVTTASDEKGRDTVYSILAKSSETLPWVAPVGRLDKASEGLLLLTNDSDWGARIAAPETHLSKTYHVQVNTLVNEKLLASLTRGVEAEDGELLRAREANLLRAGEKNCWLEIILDEGKNRQIRRMLQALAVEVLRLIRIAIGPLQIGKLAKGDFRILTPEEKLSLDRMMKTSGTTETPAAKRRKNAAHGASRASLASRQPALKGQKNG
jgi:23S rRNA pseudouridine2605 synthase